MAILQSQKTWVAKPTEISREWHLVDANGQTLGRMANKIAVLLMGKHKATYTAHTDTGDLLVVTNAEKVQVTGRKNKGKMYQASRATRVAASLSLSKLCKSAIRNKSSCWPFAACCPRPSLAIRF